MHTLERGEKGTQIIYVLCSSVLDVVEKTLGHEGVLVEVYQVGGLRGG